MHCAWPGDYYSIGLANTLPCSTPDTVLTSLLLQPSTITCCDRFDRNCQYRQHINSNTPQNRACREIPDGWPIKGCAEINVYYPSFLPTLQCTLQCVWHAQICIRGTQTFPISKLGGWKHSHHCVNGGIVRTTLTILMLWKSVGSWQQRRTVEPWWQQRTVEELRGYCPWGWGVRQVNGSTVSDAIIRSLLRSTETRSSQLGNFGRLLQVVDNWPHILW